MKQVNLLIKHTGGETGFIIHPFWKKYALFSLLAVLVSLLFFLFIHRQLSHLDSTNQRLSDYLADYQQSKTWFEEQVKKQKQLETQLHSLRVQTENNYRLNKNQSASILDLMQKLSTVMPAGVWLKDIQCSYLNQTVTLTGYSTTKTELEKLIEDGLKRETNLHDFIIQTFKRINEHNYFEFELEFQFSTGAAQSE